MAIGEQSASATQAGILYEIVMAISKSFALAENILPDRGRANNSTLDKPLWLDVGNISLSLSLSLGRQGECFAEPSTAGARHCTPSSSAVLDVE